MITTVSDESRVKRQQFLFFFSMGSISPFLSLYLKKILVEPYGIKGTALIGFLFFIQPLVAIPSVPVLAIISDKYRTGHRILFLSSTMLLFSALLFYLPGILTLNYAALIFILTGAMGLFGISSGILMPLIDSECLHFLHNEYGDGRKYGKLRMWGSAGWIISPIAAGLFSYIFKDLSISILFFVLSCLMMTFFFLNNETFNKTSQKINWSALGRNYPFISFLIFVLFLNIAITSSFNFTSWFMDDGNTSLLIMGLAFGLSAIPEIPIMGSVHRISQNIGNSNMIALGIFIEGIRLFLFLFIARIGKPEFYVALLSLHGVFWTLYYNGLINYIDGQSDPTLKTTRLSLITLSSAIGAALGGPFGVWMVNQQSSALLMKTDGYILIALAAVFLITSNLYRIKRGTV